MAMRFYLLRYHWCIYFIFLQLLFCEDNFESRNTISFKVKFPYSFKIDFELNITLFDILMRKFFDLAFQKMVDAFISRANEIY